jgi:hypothetical protein
MRGEVEAGLDWVEIVGTANDELVAPALYRRLVQSGAGPLVDADALGYLASLDAANRARNRRIWGLFREVVGGLNAAGIVPLLIKGGNDLVRLDDPGDFTRILVDVDLVVAPAELPEVERALAGLGFAPLEDSRHEHSPGSYWRRGEVAPVDLHTALPQGISMLLPTAALPRTILRERDGMRFAGPDPSLHFLITVAHEMLHDRVLFSGVTQLRYLVDLAEQDEARQDEIDWDWLAAMRRSCSFRLALDLQRLMLRHLLGVDLNRLSEPGLEARLLHRRRVFKLRQPELGFFEWRIVRRGLRAARNAGMQIP